MALKSPSFTMARPADESAGNQDAEDRPWFLQSSFMIAAATMAVIAVLGITVIATNDKSTQTPTDRAATQNTSQPPSPPLIPTAAPAGTTWNLWYGIALPSLPGIPARLDNDLPGGFAHSPEGALIAASQLPYRSLFGVQNVVVADAFLTGPGRDNALNQLRQLPSPEDTTGASQLAGFRFISYAPEQAVVELVNGSGMALKSAVITLSWEGNDWRLVTNPDGSFSQRPVPISSLAGYAPWAGVAQ